MPAEPPAAAAPASGDGRDAGYDDAERFVFGAEPVRERWLGRPLGETRGWLELARLLADPVLYGVGVPHGDGRPVVLMPGFLAGDQTLAVIAAWLRRLGYRRSSAGSSAMPDVPTARSIGWSAEPRRCGAPTAVAWR